MTEGIFTHKRPDGVKCIGYSWRHKSGDILSVVYPIVDEADAELMAMGLRLLSESIKGKNRSHKKSSETIK